MMRPMIRGLCTVAMAALALPALARTSVPAASSLSSRLLPIRAGTPLDFDDMGYSTALDRILVPAAQSGALALIDPHTQALTRWNNVVPAGPVAPHEDAGTTSADTGAGLVFVSDHADREVVALSERTHRPVARAKLASSPDYVRYVAPLREVWVSEPHKAQIERFAVHGGAHPALVHVGAVPVKGGPESLVIDRRRMVAYSNQWGGHTLEISLRDPHVIARWSNTCRGSRGLALDAADGIVLVGCKEGRVVALDPAAHGRILGQAKVGAGVDIIAWNPALRHVYAPGARSATLTVLHMGSRGQLTRVAQAPAARGSHCVATDGRRHAYVCEPEQGAIRVYTDYAQP